MIAEVTEEGIRLAMPDGKAHLVRWPHWHHPQSARGPDAVDEGAIASDEFSHDGVTHRVIIPLTNDAMHQAAHVGFHRHRLDKPLTGALLHVAARVERCALDEEGRPIALDPTRLVEPPGDAPPIGPPPGVPVPTFIPGVPARAADEG
jgi:hypothetical protein